MQKVSWHGQGYKAVYGPRPMIAQGDPEADTQCDGRAAIQSLIIQ